MKVQDLPQNLFLPLIWPILSVFVILIYFHGTSGPFLFDDFANLDALGAHGGIDDWKSLWLYLSEGDSGPTGRPISLLSFLIDDNSWPSNPSSFKYTNILIHALNGCLLFWIQFLICQEKSLKLSRKQGIAIALLASFLWLAHPMFVSTVLYVVQRMAMLSATFVLVGLLNHVYFRSKINTRPVFAYAGMTLGMGFWGLLAILSKENGVLLPSLILALEITLYSRALNLNRYWGSLFLLLPSLIILAYLLYVPLRHGFFVEWPERGFSPYERLITESRIVCEYILNLLTFRGAGSGLFRDDYILSESLFSPVSTNFCLVAVILLAIFAFIKRRVWPLFSLAVVFYLAGHLVESTSVGLELYFEHRNYLPSAFLFAPLAWLLLQIRGGYKAICLPALFFVVVFLLFARVDLWSSNVSLATAWAKDAPSSVRAQRSAAIALAQAGYSGQALSLLDNAFENNPDSHAILMHRILLKCSLGLDVGSDPSELIDLSIGKPFNPKLTNLMEVFIASMKSGACPSLSVNYMRQFLDALMENSVAKASGGFRHQLYYFMGVVSSHENDTSNAVKNFSKSIALRPKPGVFMQSLAVLASDGHCAAALRLAHQAKGLVLDSGAMVGMAQGYYQQELELMLKKIQNDCSPDLN